MDSEIETYASTPMHFADALQVWIAAAGINSAYATRVVALLAETSDVAHRNPTDELVDDLVRAANWIVNVMTGLESGTDMAARLPEGAGLRWVTSVTTALVRVRCWNSADPNDSPESETWQVTISPRHAEREAAAEREVRRILRATPLLLRDRAAIDFGRRLPDVLALAAAPSVYQDIAAEVGSDLSYEEMVAMVVETEED